MTDRSEGTTDQAEGKTDQSQETGGNGVGSASAADTAATPSLTINAQYIQDLSFENPRAPDSLTAGQPDVKVSVEVTARKLEEARYECGIGITAKATRDDETLFLVELQYAGIFTLTNIPPEQLQPVCMIECPRMLFPFARRIISDMTRDGGFPPLMIDPIDFVRLYRQRMAQGAGDGAPVGATS